MELKPGYKQTEVGVIPEEWEVVELADAARVVDSLHLTPKFADDGYPMVRVTDIKPGNLSFVGTLMVTPAVFAEFTKNYRPKRGDIVLSRVGSYGVSSFVETDEPFCMGQNTVVLQPKLPPRFLYYVLGSRSIRLQVEDGSYGSGYKSLSLKNIKELRIPVPPNDDEQRAIAAALSDVDGLLGGLDRLIAKKRDLKQAAMQQLLTGQTRLPGFDGEWEVKTLFEIATRKKELFDDGDWIESEHITSDGIRLIQTGNIGIGSFVEKDDKKYINDASFKSLRCKQLRHGDLLICRLADPAGRACVLSDIGEERIVTSVDVTIFRPPPELADRVYLCQIFSTSDWFKTVSDRSGGTTHKRISRGALGRLSISLPPLPEQTAIAAVLTEMDAELAALAQRREKTRALKQAMMQELLTGRTRLQGSLADLGNGHATAQEAHA